MPTDMTVKGDSKIRVLIVDDEPLARARIRGALAGDAEVGGVHECADGFEAVDALRKRPVDLVYLDVQMPEKSGFEVIEEVGVERMPAVVFVTAFDDYALRAFEVYALDYLLKPFDETRFKRTLERAKAQIAKAGDGGFRERLFSMVEEVRARSQHLERVLVRKGERMFFLKVRDVDWIKAEGNYVRLHAGRDSYLLRETIQSLEAALPPDLFQRVHRSAIVNLDRVKEIHQMFNGGYEFILTDGTRLPLGRKYREKILHLAED